MLFKVFGKAGGTGDLPTFVKSIEQLEGFVKEYSSYWRLDTVTIDEFEKKKKAMDAKDENRGPSPKTKTVQQLWIKAGGHCQYPNCPKNLLRDKFSSTYLNYAQVAHIIASSRNGPRGNDDSYQLSDKLSNLMLLCYEHHHLIDIDIDAHPTSLLRTWKEQTETRLSNYLKMGVHRETTLVRLVGRIGNQDVSIPFDDMATALTDRFAHHNVISIDVQNCGGDENDDYYWQGAWSSMKRQISQKLNMGTETVTEHSSLFPLAPIPLLIAAGRLLGDKKKIALYRNDRIAQSWRWQSDTGNTGSLSIREPAEYEPDLPIAVVLSISQQVDEDEVKKILGPCNVFALENDEASRIWLNREEQLHQVRRVYIELLDRIEHRCGKSPRLNVFAAVPAPVAFDIGRTIHPKVAPSMTLFEFVNSTYIPALNLPSSMI